jgi:hypothetical protein
VRQAGRPEHVDRDQPVGIVLNALLAVAIGFGPHISTGLTSVIDAALFTHQAVSPVVVVPPDPPTQP